MKNKRSYRFQGAVYELGVSTKTIHRWDEVGRLRTVRTVGKQRRIPFEEIWRLRSLGKRAERGSACEQEEQAHGTGKPHHQAAP